VSRGVAAIGRRRLDYPGSADVCDQPREVAPADGLTAVRVGTYPAHATSRIPA